MAGPGEKPNITEEEQKDLHKCKNFLMTMIQLAERDGKKEEVKNLVKELVDDRISAETFEERLQIELNCSPKPFLVPFLEDTLPLVRRSLWGDLKSN